MPYKARTNRVRAGAGIVAVDGFSSGGLNSLGRGCCHWRARDGAAVRATTFQSQTQSKLHKFGYPEDKLHSLCM